jgi:hypothetical protein
MDGLYSFTSKFTFYPLYLHLYVLYIQMMALVRHNAVFGCSTVLVAAYHLPYFRLLRGRDV